MNQLDFPFCKKDVADSRNGRKLLFCTNCKAVDTVRPPIRIPVEISPASTIPFSMEMRNFTSELKNNKWNISSFWKYFARKNKNCFKKKFGNRKIVKSKICRKLCLRGRYGAAKQSLFSSSLADANSDTLEKLQKLHPQENFKCSKPEVCPFWIENPITAIEVLKAIQKLPKGKAAGPSGISFDLLKIACSSAPEIADDLAHYFQQLIVLKINPPFELLAARLIALVKPGNGIKPDGIRPIAVGESLSRLLASIVFDRVKDKASTFLNPHQFGIKTIDGASVAAIASDTFFNAEENNFIFNLDFKNAFNSVKREAIFEVIKSDFPERSSFFYHFYGKESDLIFDSFGLKSSSGVKQGDPLGPLLFCLAIHKTLNIIKQKYPSIKIVAYMDDISLIGSFDLLELVAQEIADSYENIGLHLNASKCLLIGSSAQDLVINDSIVPFTNYSSDAFKFLGCWLGNVPQIQNELQVILEKMKIELDSISSSDTFFNAEENNFIFNLDFKNAFNSVKREVIFEVIKSDFPELSSFFYHFYGKESDLIFNSFGLKSSSGVKQGEPLGPLLFCLAIHKTLNIIKQKYPSIKIVAYMDDISLIGSFDLLELVAQEIADSYENIGLHLNASKCLLIGSSAQDLVINDSIVPFTNYSSDAFKFLGCWLGNVPQIQNELQVILEKMKIELDSISSLDIEKHIKFFMLKICYTGRITHILRSCAPSIALDFCRSFNSLRTEFFADLLDVEPGMLKSHLFSSSKFGCPYLYELSCELEKLPPQIWTKCFPQSIQEIPNRSLFNLQFCCKKLQQKLSKIFESLDFDVRLGLAKKKNPAFANLLQDMCDSTSSALVTTIPQVYGTLLSDSAWTLNMRFRSFIWPDNLPHNLICKCSREITTTHLLNCKHFITFRSKVHDAVRDQLYCMCKSHRIESFLEPLLSNLFDAENDFHKNNRGDVILPGLDGSFILLDVMSVDPCNASNERLVNSEIHNPLSNAENFKFKKIQ
ncbi:hypothetical protein P9112_013637 [Eukaryota sp. TZLM1-RC]